MMQYEMTNAKLQDKHENAIRNKTNPKKETQKMEPLGIDEGQDGYIANIGKCYKWVVTQWAMEMPIN